MAGLELYQLWTVGAVVAGFQVAALTWRINREIYVEERRLRGTNRIRRNARTSGLASGSPNHSDNQATEPTWVTVADGVVFASFLLLIGGVFALPAVRQNSIELATDLLGLSLLMFGLSQAVLAGHYNLYCSKRHSSNRIWFTFQEKVASAISLILVVLYAVLVIVVF